MLPAEPDGGFLRKRGPGQDPGTDRPSRDGVQHRCPVARCSRAGRGVCRQPGGACRGQNQAGCQLQGQQRSPGPEPHSFSVTGGLYLTGPNLPEAPSCGEVGDGLTWGISAASRAWSPARGALAVLHGGPVTAAPTRWPPDACAAPAPGVQTSIGFRGLWLLRPLCWALHTPTAPPPSAGCGGESSTRGSRPPPQGQLGLVRQPWAAGSGDRPFGIKAVRSPAAAGSSCDSALVRGAGAARRAARARGGARGVATAVLPAPAPPPPRERAPGTLAQRGPCPPAAVRPRSLQLDRRASRTVVPAKRDSEVAALNPHRCPMRPRPGTALHRRGWGLGAGKPPAQDTPPVPSPSGPRRLLPGPAGTSSLPVWTLAVGRARREGRWPRWLTGALLSCPGPLPPGATQCGPGRPRGRAVGSVERPQGRGRAEHGVFAGLARAGWGQEQVPGPWWPRDQPRASG